MGFWGPHESCIYSVVIGGVVLLYNGKEWNKVDTGSYDSLNSAFGFDENNVFLYGVGGRMLYWNGEKWDYREPNTIHDLFGMWGEDIEHIYTVGGEGIYRFYDGTQFLRKDELTEETVSLFGVWGLSLIHI